MNRIAILATLTACTAMSVPASAAVISLDFEGVNATYPSGFASIGNFYNGGTSSDGTTGTNYGISFGSNALAICLNSTTVSCSATSRGGLGDAGSQRGGLFFTSGTETFLNYAAGFDTGFSFFYASVSYSGSVGVYDGVDGTGNLLATLSLTPQASGCSSYGAAFCPFVAAGVTFSGTARSIAFAGVANQIVFDDVTFGSATPGESPAPEPATWAMMLVGFGGIGTAVRRARRSSRSAAIA